MKIFNMIKQNIMFCTTTFFTAQYFQVNNLYIGNYSNKINNILQNITYFNVYLE